MKPRLRKSLMISLAAIDRTMSGTENISLPLFA
jgi:hypothetical protein